MNSVRKIDLKRIQNMNDTQALIFSFFHGRKGRSFTADTLLEKLSKNLIDEENEEPEKAKKKAISDIKTAFTFLNEAGVIEKSTKEGKEVENQFTMPAYNIEDLPEEKQVKIGDKIHTSLTANSSTVFYKGDAVLYIPHPLSPEYKGGQRVCVGELKNFHVNEEGFLYLVLLKPQKFDSERKPLKRKQCAVKGSKAQLVDEVIPKGVAECVTYKKSAGLKLPLLEDLSEIDKGEKILFFTNVWSPNSLHMKQILEGLQKAKKLAKGVTLVEVNTDHQVAECNQYNIRTAPTLVRIKNGKEVGRIENVPNENPNEQVLKFNK